MAKRKNKQSEIQDQLRRRHKQAREHIVKKIDVHRREYEVEWQADAQYFSETGAYEWMCDAIGNGQLILEIGSGTGQSTLALARRNHRLVVVEENPYCCRTTERTLSQNEIQSELCERGIVKGRTNDQYDQEYSPMRIERLSTQVTIIEGDMIFDEGLKDWLARIGPFDGIVCWLIGTNVSRQLVSGFPKLPWRSNGEYRLRVQNKVFELADRVLRKGGVLNLIDRGELPSEEEKDHLTADLINSFRDQASVTSLVVEQGSLRHREYNPEKIVGGKQMILTPGASGRMPHAPRLALTSICAIKC